MPRNKYASTLVLRHIMEQWQKAKSRVYYGGNWLCTSIDQLNKETGIPTRTIKYALSRLRDKGRIETCTRGPNGLRIQLKTGADSSKKSPTGQ
jgi:predicted transcriptional regulator of viral defense system